MGFFTVAGCNLAQNYRNENKDFRKFFTSVIDWKPLTPPLHLIIVNQQIFIAEIITWMMLFIC